jgi:hypothetical protein
VDCCAFREDLAMAFFKRELSPVERFKAALKSKEAERQNLAGRLSAAESVLAEQRADAERLAVAGASNSKLERAEAKLRSFEDRAKTLRAALSEIDEQIVATERALADARSQRDREVLADNIEALAASIEQAVPGFAAGAAALVRAVTRSRASVPEASKFAASVDAVRGEVVSAADLLCWELRSIAMRTRAGNVNVNVALLAPPEATQPRIPEIERQVVYTLNPLLWRESSEVRKVPAFARVELPKTLLPLALRHQHVDYLNARRVQTLMHVHGIDATSSDTLSDDAQFIDLDALAAEEQAQANVA